MKRFKIMLSIFTVLAYLTVASTWLVQGTEPVKQLKQNFSEVQAELDKLYELEWSDKLFRSTGEELLK